MLVVFEEGQKTFDNYMDLKFYLEDLFGREVDLVTERALKPQLKDIIMKEVVSMPEKSSVFVLSRICA